MNNFFALTNSRVKFSKFLVIRVSSPEAALLKIQCSSLAKKSHNNDICLSLNLGLKSESNEPVNFIEKSDLCFQLVSFLANCLYQLHFHRQVGHATRQIHEIFVWFSRKFLQFEPGFHTKLHFPHWLLRVLYK